MTNNMTKAGVESDANQVCSGQGGLSLKDAPDWALSINDHGIRCPNAAHLVWTIVCVLSQIETAPGMSVSSESPLFVWSVKCA